MLVVSCRLFACSRAISSWMLTSESEVTCLQLLDLRFELGDRLFEIEEGNGHDGRPIPRWIRLRASDTGGRRR